MAYSEEGGSQSIERRRGTGLQSNSYFTGWLVCVFSESTYYTNKKPRNNKEDNSSMVQYNGEILSFRQSVCG